MSGNTTRTSDEPRARHAVGGAARHARGRLAGRRAVPAGRRRVRAAGPGPPGPLHPRPMSSSGSSMNGPSSASAPTTVPFGGAGTPSRSSPRAASGPSVAARSPPSRAPSGVAGRASPPPRPRPERRGPPAAPEALHRLPDRRRHDRLVGGRPLAGLAQEQEVARLRLRRALEVLEHQDPAPAPAAGQVGGPGPLRDLGPQLGRLDQRKVGHGTASRRAATMAPPGLPSSVVRGVRTAPRQQRPCSCDEQGQSAMI